MRRSVDPGATNRKHIVDYGKVYCSFIYLFSWCEKKTNVTSDFFWIWCIMIWFDRYKCNIAVMWCLCFTSFMNLANAYKSYAINKPPSKSSRIKILIKCFMFHRSRWSGCKWTAWTVTILFSTDLNDFQNNMYLIINLKIVHIFFNFPFTLSTIIHEGRQGSRLFL